MYVCIIFLSLQMAVLTSLFTKLEIIFNGVSLSLTRSKCGYECVNRVILVKSLAKPSLFARLKIIILGILLHIQRMQSYSRTGLSNSIVVESSPNYSPARYNPKYN